MASLAMGVTPEMEVGLRARIRSHMKLADRETKSLLKEILEHLDRPYDLSWLQDEFRLSPAEFKVLTLMAKGERSKSISEMTGTARSTVQRQIHDIYKKTRVRNMAELTALLLDKARNA